VNSQSTLDSISETLSKKELVESLDNNILHIENIRNRIECLDETCKDIVDDMRLANCDPKKIPESYVTRLDQMEKELTGLDTSICSGISDLQNLRFDFYQEIHPRKVLHEGNRQRRREREIKEIEEQII
jgi:hypothetical protein